jgi:hypothetical protein
MTLRCRSVEECRTIDCRCIDKAVLTRHEARVVLNLPEITGETNQRMATQPTGDNQRNKSTNGNPEFRRQPEKQTRETTTRRRQWQPVKKRREASTVVQVYNMRERRSAATIDPNKNRKLGRWKHRECAVHRHSNNEKQDKVNQMCKMNN